MVAKKCIIIMMATIFMSWTSFALTEVVDGITWTYTVENGCASVGGGSSSSPAIPKSTSGAITIPSNLGGYAVTNIGSYAFYGCSGLTSVTMHSGVASVGPAAFRSCSGLTSVTIPRSVANIGNQAFDGCSKLANVHVDDVASWCRISFGNYYSNPLVYANKFYMNGELVTNLEIPSSVTTIGDFAFSKCSGLTSVTIPDTVTRIGAYGGASIGINVKRSREAKGSETDETSPTRRAVCGKTARTVR